jgi:hypothetical protein
VTSFSVHPVPSGKSKRNRGKGRRSRACGAKIAYAQEAAVRAAMAMSKRAGVKYRAYRCQFCYLPSGACAWHIGHALSLRRRLG